MKRFSNHCVKVIAWEHTLLAQLVVIWTTKRTNYCHASQVRFVDFKRNVVLITSDLYMFVCGRLGPSKPLLQPRRKFDWAGTWRCRIRWCDTLESWCAGKTRSNRRCGLFPKWQAQFLIWPLTRNVIKWNKMFRWNLLSGLRSLPPGCLAITCAHQRAPEFYAESVYPGNEYNFIGVKCNSLSSLDGKFCPGKGVPMGKSTSFILSHYKWDLTYCNIFQLIIHKMYNSNYQFKSIVRF